MNDYKNGKQWSLELGVEIEYPKGWQSKEDYEMRLITKAEYCNRAANSNPKANVAATRRQAYKMLNEKRIKRQT
jgi:hypothetical protein